MGLPIDCQTYHAFPFPHSMHPTAALHLPAETFLLWFCGHKFSLSFLAIRKCFGKPLLMFAKAESFDLVCAEYHPLRCQLPVIISSLGLQVM